jgi:hypothetical protein
MYQYLGNITVKGELGYSAMFCSDADQPDLATIHWWPIEGPGQAVVFQLEPINKDNYKLLPVLFYIADNNGGMFLPVLQESDVKKMQSFSGTLQKCDDAGYVGSWQILDEKEGEFYFYGELLAEKSAPLEPTICDRWADFKVWADTLRITHPDSAFRGHGSNEWTLTTTINRIGRTRLERYYAETIQHFKILAEVALEKDFDLTNASDYSTLLGLAQHHGLPSPLLDITESPYVAAYFAFADAVEYKREPESYVRIYAISGDYIRHHAFPTVPLAAIRPYVASLTVPPRHNPRMHAQQGKFIVTNIVDLEDYLIGQSLKFNVPILFAADIKVSCAYEALQDLKYMGLTAGTLFPGLDGTSRMMKQMMMVSNSKGHLELLPQESSTIIDQSHPEGQVEISKKNG